jgi:hypothetical protein
MKLHGLPKRGPLIPHTEQEIRSEPMFFSAKPSWIERQPEPAPIHNAFIRATGIDDDWIIDSRLHMLMPGHYPCIPGWHLDDIPRTQSGQPDLHDPGVGSELKLACFGVTAFTEFIAEEIDWEPTTEAFHADLDATIMRGGYEPICYPESGRVLELTHLTPHRGQPSIEKSWRLFIRATKRTNRPHYPLNQRRTQVNCYIPAGTVGW